MIREAQTREDFEGHVACFSAIWPEDAVSIDFILERKARESERLYLNAWDGYRVIGTGFVGRSQSRPSYRPIAVTVLPDCRGRGLGGKLLVRCLEHARAVGGATAIGTVREDETEAVDFLFKRGFEVMDRVVSLVLDLAPEMAEQPAPPEGIRVVELEETRYEDAFAVYCDGVEDIPSDSPAQRPAYPDWVAEVKRNLLNLVALDGDRVVGFANLEIRNTPLGVTGNGLTTVARSHRGRGIAVALKRAEVAWGAARGYRQITTSTHAANGAMQRVNRKLGYRELPALLDVVRPLG